jgi:hypothetical protein
MTESKKETSENNHIKRFTSSILSDPIGDPRVIKITPSLTSSDNMNFSDKKESSSLKNSKEP